MAFVGQIEAQLKANNADFKAKMQEAGEATEGLDKKLKKFGLGFGGIGALAMTFRAVVDHARELNGELDENEKRAKAFALGLDSAKKAALDVGVQVLGVANGLGEWIGKQIAIARYGEDAVNLNERIAAQTEETLATIEKAKAAQLEANKIREQTAVIERKATDEAVKQLDLSEQILIAKSRVAAATDEIARAGGDVVAKAQAELSAARERLELQKLEATQTKQLADAKKKADDEAAKAAAKTKEDRDNAHIAAMDRIESEKAAKKKAAEDRVAAERSALGTMDEQLDRLRKQGVSREQIIATLRQQGNSEEDILKKLEAQTEQLQFQTTIKSKGRGDTDLSDRVLQDKILNLQAGIAEIDRDVTGRRYNSSTRAQMQKELDFAKDELGDRGRIRQQVGQFGEEGAARFYRGEVDQFERLLKFVNPQDSQQRTAAGIEELNGRLSSLFPKRNR